MSNSNEKIQTDMKQKLLNILSEKNNKVICNSKACGVSLDNHSLSRKHSQRSYKLPIEMTKFERERWLFEIMNTQDLAKQEQELKEIYLRTTKLVTKYRNKEIKWNKKREALQNEIELLRQLLQQS